MLLHEKAIKELNYGMNMPNETDIVFVALWVSRHINGRLNVTVCHVQEEKLTDELREKIAAALHTLGDNVSVKKVDIAHVQE